MTKWVLLVLVFFCTSEAGMFTCIKYLSAIKASNIAHVTMKQLLQTSAKEFVEFVKDDSSGLSFVEEKVNPPIKTKTLHNKMSIFVMICFHWYAL